MTRATSALGALVALSAMLVGCVSNRHAEFCDKQCDDRGGVRKITVSPAELRCDCIDDQNAASPDTEPGR